MNKYRLIGDYVGKEITSLKNKDCIDVTIPFLDVGDTIKYGINHVLNKLKANGIYPTEDGIDILALAGLVYLADTRISRSLHSQDSWTRLDWLH